MDTSLKNSKAFTDAIKKMSAEECEKINRETNEIKTQRLEAFKSEAQNSCNDYVSYELARIKAEKNSKISALEEESRKTLSELRNELTEKVFDKVTADIIAFTKTDAYHSLIISFVKEIYDSAADKSNIEFFVRKEDMSLKEEINDIIGKFIHISVCDDIVLGGIKAVDHNTGCLFDNTLDLKLEEQRTWFLENSKLKI